MEFKNKKIVDKKEFENFKIIPLKQNFAVKEEKIDWWRKYTPEWALPKRKKSG